MDEVFVVEILFYGVEVVLGCFDVELCFVECVGE